VAERTRRPHDLRAPRGGRGFAAHAAAEPPDSIALSAAVRALDPARPWSQIRRLITTGKVSVDGARLLDPGARLAPGAQVTVNLNAADPARARRPAGFAVAFEDAHLIVIEKPEGVSTVPWDRKEVGTALDLIRDEWRRQGRRATEPPLYVVHRLDKDTSGLLCFAKTKLAERGLHAVFKQHLAERTYVAVAHGQVLSQRIESRLVPDRGDGLRGRARFPGQGQRAVTHVEAVERFAASPEVAPRREGDREATARATLCRVRLETGRTHQIRIHLSEAGHPLVGETVYIRDYERAGHAPLPARRLLLHAQSLGLEHPVTHERLVFLAPPPADFVAELEPLRTLR
jgi:23S rRNA pseudouridine1911/1915/1917 synthase